MSTKSAPIETVNVRITKQWLNFIIDCTKNCPYGEVRIKLAAGSPTNLVEAKPDKRYDRDESTVVTPVVLQNAT